MRLRALLLRAHLGVWLVAAPLLAASCDGGVAGTLRPSPREAAAVCGDGVCSTGETCATCAKDCGACAVECSVAACNDASNGCVGCPDSCSCGTCGDGVCSRETCDTCPADCGACAPCPPPGKLCDGACTTCDAGEVALCGAAGGRCCQRGEKLCDEDGSCIPEDASCGTCGGTVSVCTGKQTPRCGPSGAVCCGAHDAFCALDGACLPAGGSCDTCGGAVKHCPADASVACGPTGLAACCAAGTIVCEVDGQVGCIPDGADCTKAAVCDGTVQACANRGEGICDFDPVSGQHGYLCCGAEGQRACPDPNVCIDAQFTCTHTDCPGLITTYCRADETPACGAVTDACCREADQVFCDHAAGVHGACWPKGTDCATVTFCNENYDACLDGQVAHCGVERRLTCCAPGEKFCDDARGDGCWPAGTDCQTIVRCPDGGVVACPTDQHVDCAATPACVTD